MTSSPDKTIDWRSVLRVVLKAAALFVMVNLLFAVLNPLPAIGRISVYNGLVPGRQRLPYGEQPEAYNLSLDSLEAMFSTHEISRSKPTDEYRILIAGDSSVWGILLRPDETLAAQINAANLTLDGRPVRAYNIGHPILSVTKDLMLIDYALRYEPDMIIWLVTLQSLPVDAQLTAPLVRNNAPTVRDLITRYHLPLNASDPQLIMPDFWNQTLIGQRRALADWWRLQLYGFSWAQTGIDQVYGDYTPRSNDFESDATWRGRTETDGLDHDDLLLDVFDAVRQYSIQQTGIQQTGVQQTGVQQTGIPLWVINEPIYIADGENSDLRYNFWYPRWTYDRYRDLMQQAHKQASEQGGDENHWNYLDLWDSIAPDEFTDSPVHLTPSGTRQLAQHIIAALRGTDQSSGEG